MSDLFQCYPKPELKNRELLTSEQAANLKSVFKVLANDTRLRLLHALVRADELCVTNLAKMMNMKPQAISNQLQRLVDQGIVIYRRNGNQIYYHIIDPCVISLLDKGLCLTEDTERRRI